MNDFQLIDEDPLEEQRTPEEPRYDTRLMLPPPPDRSPPYSAEAEEHVIACCLLDGKETVIRSVSAGIRAEFFYSQANRLLYSLIVDLQNRFETVTLEMLAEELKRKRMLEAVGGFQYLMQVTGKIPTTAHAGYFIEKVKEKYLLREMIKAATGAVEQAYAFSGGLTEFTKQVDAEIQRVIRQAEVVTTPAKPFTDFKLGPKDSAKNLLGRNRYINRGDSAILVSSSGMGKSSISLQMATLFALGRPAFGIPCAKADGIRSLIIQAEDSDEDIAEVWASIMFMLKLSAAEVAQVRSKVIVVRDKVNRGPAFIHNMQLLAERHLPDIIWINPLQNYIAGGDVTDNNAVADFLYDGLNKSNVQERWAYFIVHHTTKPATGANAPKGPRNWNEQMYEMAGAAKLIDWARAILILKATKEQGEFNLNLAKRGPRAGVVKKVGLTYEPTTVIPLKHAKGSIELEGREPLPIVFWEPREELPPDPNAPPPPDPRKPKAGSDHANTVYPDGQIVSYFPSNDEEACNYSRLQIDVKTGCGMGNSAFAKRCQRFLEEQLIIQRKEPGQLGMWRRTAKGDELAREYLEAQP